MDNPLTAKDFQEPLLRAIWLLANGQPGVFVNAADTYSLVVSSMGLSDTNALGIEASSGQPLVIRQIQWACKNLRGTGHLSLEEGRRGRWALTAKSVDSCFPPKEETMETVGFSFSPEEGAMETQVRDRSPCFSDPHILKLVLGTAACLGHYTPHKGAVCVTCPVAQECQKALYSRMSAEALRLKLLDNPVTPAVSVASPKEGVPPRVRAAVRASKKAESLKAFEDVECAACREFIRTNSMMKWFDDPVSMEPMMLHVSCYEDLLKT